jgi:hypothetical protein
MDIAIPIAHERGEVMEFRQTSENLCEFLIIGNGCLAMVRVRKARRLHGTVAGIEADFSGAVIRGRTIPCGGPVSRELWLYSRFCVMRFFRITDTGLTEIDRHGRPLVTATAGPAVPATTAPFAGEFPEGERSSPPSFFILMNPLGDPMLAVGSPSQHINDPVINSIP